MKDMEELKILATGSDTIHWKQFPKDLQREQQKLIIMMIFSDHLLYTYTCTIKVTYAYIKFYILPERTLTY